MAQENVTQLLNDAWETLEASWSADIRSRYRDQIFLPLVQQAEKLRRSNEELEDYADQCLRSVRMV